jgi:hypothetical protein
MERSMLQWMRRWMRRKVDEKGGGCFVDRRASGYGGKRTGNQTNYSSMLNSGTIAATFSASQFGTALGPA